MKETRKSSPSSFPQANIVQDIGQDVQWILQDCFHLGLVNWFAIIADFILWLLLSEQNIIQK